MESYLKFASVLFAAGVVFFAYSQQGCASGIAQQTCDTEVWKTMEDRAHLEAEREIMQNQNLIFKPDSILSYTCFDNMAAHASLFVGQLFTHTKYWNGKEIIEWGAPYGMDNAMQKVVIDSLKPYIEGSFKYAMLGGRGNQLSSSGNGAQAAGSTGSYSQAVASSSGLGERTPRDIGSKGRTYECDIMNKVWKAAKCMNFIHNSQFATTDGFYPFIGLEPQDGGTRIKGYDEIKETRKYPSQLSCAGGSEPIIGKSGSGSGGQEKSSWEVAYRDSRNETDFGVKDRYYQYGTPLGEAFQKVREKVEPAGTCSNPPIKTGVKVLETPSGNKRPYDDGVCTNPGCTYVEGTCKKAFYAEWAGPPS